MRLALKILAGLVALAVLLPIAAFGVLQTRMGKDWLAQKLGAEGLEGTVPFDLRVAALRYEDWFVARNVHLAIAPADLLHRRLTIRDLSADSVDVLRLPEGGGQGGGGGGIALPFDLALHSARVKKLHLAEPVLGEAVTVAVEARGFVGAGHVEGHLAIDRTDGQPGRIALDAALRDGRLKVVALADEPSGTLLRRFAGKAAPLRVDIAGDGPLADWHGEIRGTAGALAELWTRLSIEGETLTAEGEASASGFLPASLQRLAFNAVAALDRQELRELRVATDDATLLAHGSYGEKKRVEARLELRDLAAFVPFSGPASASAVAELDGERLVVPHFEASDGNTTITGAAEKEGEKISGNAHLASADLSRYGALAGTAQLDARVATVAGAIVADFEGTLGKLGAAGASIDSGKLTGEVRYANGAATATIDATLAGIAGGPATAAAAELHLTGDRAADGTTNAALEGRVEGIGTGTPEVDALIGPEMRIAARARHEGGALRLESATVDGAALHASASGRLADQLAASFALELPRLAAIGAGIAGRVSIHGTARGPLDAIEVAAKAEAEDVAYGGQRLDRLVADVAGTQTGARIDAAFKAAGLEGTLAGSVAQRGQAIEVKNLRLAASGTTVNADLSLVPEARTATGTVTARIADLAPWSALAGMKLAGRASLDARLTGRDVDLKLDAARLAVGETTVEKLDGTAHVADALGSPSGRAKVTVAKARVGGGEVGALRLEAKAPTPEAVSFDGDVQARFQEPVRLAFAGKLERGTDGQTLRLARLDGSVAGQRVALNKPLVATSGPGGYGISGLDLAVGPGRVGGSASLKGATIAAALSARRLPVGTLAKLLGQEASGELGLELSASGTLEKPEARLVLDGRDLRTHPEIPPLGVVAEAHLSGQRVDLRGRVDGLQGAALGFSGFAPLRLRKAPFAVELPPNEAISLHAEGDGELASLADLLPIGEDRLSGRFHLDATVSGTMAAPKAAGVLTLANGRYENLTLGTVVSDIAAELAGDNDRFVLHRFSARDGSGGALSAEGGVLLSATPGPAFDLSASLRRFRVLARDDMTALASGEARVSGTLTAPRLIARLRVDEAELRVPEGASASAAKLDVIEIDSRTGKRLTPETEPAGEPRHPATLDVAVEIPGQTFVRGRGLDSEWRGRINVTGTTAAPEVVGRLEVAHGSFDLLGKRFALARGIISFDGGERIDPRLDIIAQVQASGTTAQAIIGGTGSQPTLRLASTPELPQDEILARVLFSRNAGQLTPAQGLQLAQAAATLAQGGPGVLDRLRGKLGLDRLDVGSGNGSATDPTVSAGKYVAEGVYLGVDHSVSGESKAKVEVELTPNITVETDVGSRGGGPGIGLNWKRDY